MANLPTVMGISYMSAHLRFRNLRRTNGVSLTPDKDEKERTRNASKKQKSNTNIDHSGDVLLCWYQQYAC
jgi:hypothetical protein